MTVGEDAESVAIRVSPGKTIPLLLFAALFILLAIGAFLWAQQAEGIAAFVSYLFAAINLLWAVPTGVLYLWNLVDPSRVLAITADGIEDRTTLFGAGMVPWSEVVGIKERTYGLEGSAVASYVLIFVRHPDEFVERSHGLSRLLLRHRFSFFGTPIAVSTAFLRIANERLASMLQGWVAKHG